MDTGSVTTTQEVPSGTTNSVNNAAGSGVLSIFLPFICIMVLFYFLMIRPQQKKDAQKRERVNQLKKGDKLVTSGGLICTFIKFVGDKEVKVEISDGVDVVIYRNFIVDILSDNPNQTKGSQVDAKSKYDSASENETNESTNKVNKTVKNSLAKGKLQAKKPAKANKLKNK